MSPLRTILKFLFISLLVFAAGTMPAAAQSVSRLSGIVVDQNGALIAGVEITIINAGGTLERTVRTDLEGFFAFPFLPPDEYNLKISKEGFDPAEVPNLLVAEETERQLKIELKINPIAETLKVESAPAAADENRAGLTTLDRDLLENFPRGARQYQSLIGLVPGVVLTPVDNNNLGQFSSNGQRTNANFFTVDGVPANFGTTNYDFLGQTGSGSIPATSIQGGLDNLVAPESVQELKIQTLDFAPATGKMPGATVSFVSRAGGGDYSFSAFENFRNGVFNARDFFDLEKPPHIFNDFGGSFGGPLFFPKQTPQSNNRTYFFFSFEGKRFTLPQPTVTTAVPSKELRENTTSEVAQAIYNAFPMPNEKDDKPPAELLTADNAVAPDASPLADFTATEAFRATYSDPNNSENYNLRLDHIFNSRFSFFARFNYSPSFSENRNPENLSSFISSNQITRTFTIGAVQTFSSSIVNEFRFNLSRQNGNTVHDFDGRYGGVLPDKSIFIPASFETDKTHFRFALNGFPDGLGFFYGNYAENEMRQLVFSDNFSVSAGAHEIKFGFDYRELSPTLRASGYGIEYDFNTPETIALGTASRASFYKNPNVSTRVRSISSFVQDNWKVNSRVSLLYGFRWEINPAPRSEEKDALLTLQAAPDLAQADQTGLVLAPAGTAYYETSYRNFAPRFGAAIEVFSRKNAQFVLRGGVGTFYDLGQSQFNEITSPFGHLNGFAENLNLPIVSDPFTFLGESEGGKRLTVAAAADDYALPRTYFWNLTAQLKLGSHQLFSTAYVGGAGRRLQRTLTLNLGIPGKSPNGYFSSEFSKIIYIDNAYSSDYHSLQFQHSLDLASGFKSFVNYAWSHSIDNNSSDSRISTPFLNYPVENDRGNSDFDARHALNIGFTYELPEFGGKSALGVFLKNWTFGGIFFARAGLPYDVEIAEYNARRGEFDVRRADPVGSLPVFLETPSSATGRRLNPEAFTRPAEEFKRGILGRNAFNGPAVWQFDASLSRQIKLADKLRLQLRLEVYNVFNRPNFSNPESTILYRDDEKIVPQQFGAPTRSMARGYAAEPTGGVSPIFQLGGSRSLQFGIRLRF
jgi:hypothetical protein